jgi:hypothetical protein
VFPSLELNKYWEELLKIVAHLHPCLDVCFGIRSLGFIFIVKFAKFCNPSMYESSIEMIQERLTCLEGLIA